MKKRQLFIATLLCSSALIVAADVQSLVVQLKSGSEIVSALSTVQRITFSGTTMTVLKKDATQTNYTINTVQKLLFDLRSATAIKETTSILNNVKAYPNPTTDIIFVEGIKTVENLRLYTLAGNQLTVSHSLLNNVLQLNVSALPKGFYILQVNNQTIKIQKQ